MILNLPDSCSTVKSYDYSIIVHRISISGVSCIGYNTEVRCDPQHKHSGDLRYRISNALPRSLLRGIIFELLSSAADLR